MRTSFEGVVRDPDGRAFAVPRVELQDLYEFHLVERVNAAVEALCGARVTTLRCLSSERTAGKGRHRFYELEAHGPVRGLKEVEVETPPPGNPWELPGWFDEVAAWIRERVDAPVEQRSTWSISTVLRAGDAYFKAVPPLFGSEPAITRALSAEHPGRVPEVLDVDLERGWLLMRDFGGERLSTAHPPDVWVDALRAYADLQRAWAGRAEELLAIGCPDRRLEQLGRDLDVVLGDFDAMQADGLSEEQLAAVPELRERLRKASARVEAFEIALTLDHGDLHAGNIAVRDSGPLFFDWSDGCLTLPIFSVTPILVWDDPPEAARARDAYLERLGAPAEAWDDAILLGFAHQSVSYYRMTEAMAPHARWEWERVFPILVKELLQRI